MTLALFLVDQLPAGDSVVLEGDEARHALVKRVRRGEQVQIGDGRGTIVGATVLAVERNRVELSVDWRLFNPQLEPRLVVVQALPKGGRADLAVELLTELGADEIVPWAAANSVARWDGDRAGRGVTQWQSTAREAAKQSRRAWLPVVSALATTADVAERLGGAAAGLVLDADTTDGGLAFCPLPAAGEVVLVVGPEGGLTGAELDQFAATGAALVQLGVEVLRTSTAGGAALAALSLRLGRWR